MTQKKQQSSIDDWTINVTPFPSVAVPSFIRLFVINRILSSLRNKNFKKTTQEWLNDMKNVNLHQKETARNILLNLLKHNIKDYMKYCFDDREQSNAIEIIFYEIILKKFKNEYDIMTNYPISDLKNSDNFTYESYYQDSVFGTKDLMNLILQYLEWDWTLCELLNCSLINSYWFFQAWNVKPSKNHVVDLDKITYQTLEFYDTFFGATTGDDDNDKLRLTSAWQRLAHARSIRIVTTFLDTASVHKQSWCEVLNKLAMLKNVSAIDFWLDDEDIDALKVLMQNCKSKIESVDAYIWMDNRERSKTILSPLELPNMCKIQILCHHMCFYYKWSNKCQVLSLADLVHVKLSVQWIEFVINNCDCSNIKTLQLNQVLFHDSVSSDLLKNFANKFQSLQRLELVTRKGHDYLLLFLFCKHLIPIMKKNKTKIAFVTDMCCRHNWARICNMIDDKIFDNNNIHIAKFHVVFGRWTKRMREPSIKKLLRNETLEWLKIEIDNQETIAIDDETHPNSLEHFCYCLQDRKLLSTSKSLQVIEIENIKSFGVLISFLSLKIIHVCRLFVIVVVSDKFVLNVDDKSVFIDEFDQLFKIVNKLLFTQMVAMDISIEFRSRELKYVKHDCLKLFAQYFDQTRILNQYVQPKCNEKYYEALEKPKISFDCYRDKYYDDKACFVVKNARAVKPQLFD